MSGITKPIAIVGMMGSGKSTVGRKLARKLNFQFYDSDRVIEERNGINVSDIFEFRGEDYFRSQEKKVIEEILGYGAVVLSTGCDSFMSEEIRQLIKDRSISVWLLTDIKTLHERVTRRVTRPQLKDEDPMELLKRTIEERKDIYSEADITVQSADNETHFVVDIILSKIKKGEY